MIIDLFLGIIQVVVNVLLAPLSAFSFGLDIVTKIPVVMGFIKVISFIFPWSQITPIITIIVAIFAFRAIVALIKTIWELLPVL